MQQNDILEEHLFNVRSKFGFRSSLLSFDMPSPNEEMRGESSPINQRSVASSDGMSTVYSLSNSPLSE